LTQIVIWSCAASIWRRPRRGSGLLDAVEAEEVVVITRRGRSVARLIRESDGEAGSAVELLRELHNQKP